MFTIKITIISIYRYITSFNNSNGNVLITILMHLFINAGAVLLLFPALENDYELLYLLATPALVLFTARLGWRTRFRSESGLLGLTALLLKLCITTVQAR